jgi:hypothetical protein
MTVDALAMSALRKTGHSHNPTLRPKRECPEQWPALGLVKPDPNARRIKPRREAGLYRLRVFILRYSASGWPSNEQYRLFRLSRRLSLASSFTEPLMLRSPAAVSPLNARFAPECSVPFIPVEAPVEPMVEFAVPCKSRADAEPRLMVSPAAKQIVSGFIIM